uniref:Uncharacterized protein n=1 Tax=Pundamilia nyererei TaxID=303518 RepID=A0A3B4FQP0_9CICH
MPGVLGVIARRAAPVLRGHVVAQRASIYTRPAKDKIGSFCLVSIRSLSLTLLAVSGSKLHFRSQSQTNTAASLRVKNCLNFFICNKMISVAALPGVTIKFNIQASIKTEFMKFNGVRS